MTKLFGLPSRGDHPGCAECGEHGIELRCGTRARFSIQREETNRSSSLLKDGMCGASDYSVRRRIVGTIVLLLVLVDNASKASQVLTTLDPASRIVIKGGIVQ